MEEKSNAVIRTERRLRAAYAELLSKKSHKEISVKELADKAEMSRAAFYLHFGSLEEFSFNCKYHLMSELTRQLIFWLDSRGNIEYVCKKKNLIISQADRELFCCYFLQKIYFEDPDFQYIRQSFCKYFKEKFSDEFVFENASKIDFFVRAYSVTFMDLFVEYNGERAKKELKYVFQLWDKLFPGFSL